MACAFSLRSWHLNLIPSGGRIHDGTLINAQRRYLNCKSPFTERLAKQPECRASLTAPQINIAFGHRSSADRAERPYDCLLITGGMIWRPRCSCRWASRLLQRHGEASQKFSAASHGSESQDGSSDKSWVGCGFGWGPFVTRLRSSSTFLRGFSGTIDKRQLTTSPHHARETL